MGTNVRRPGMAHVTTVTREAGKYHLKCEECGLITAQPANRGGLIARGERHQQSGGAQGGPKGLIKVRVEQVKRLEITYGEEPTIEFVNPKPFEVTLPATIQATPKTYVRPAFQWAMFDDKCMQCGGPLRSPEGSFCTTAFPVRAICRGCKFPEVVA
jgi:ferredoxin